jgi:hypothetical protein
MRARLRGKSAAISALPAERTPGGREPSDLLRVSDINPVLMSAPYASMARSVFLEAMWPTRKAMPSRSTSLIMLSSVTRRRAYSGEIS